MPETWKELLFCLKFRNIFPCQNHGGGAGQLGRLVISSYLAGSNWLLCSFGLGTIWKTFPRLDFILGTDRCPSLRTHQTRPTGLKPSWAHKWKRFGKGKGRSKMPVYQIHPFLPLSVQWEQPLPTANCLWVQGRRFYQVALLKSTGQRGTCSVSNSWS